MSDVDATEQPQVEEVQESTPAPKGKMSVEDALQEVIKKALVRWPRAFAQTSKQRRTDMTFWSTHPNRSTMVWPAVFASAPRLSTSARPTSVS